MKILIVEDEPKTGDYLRQGLREAGFAVLEDRGEGSVPAQGHSGLRGSQPGPEGVLGEPKGTPNGLEIVRTNWNQFELIMAGQKRLFN